MLEADIYSAKAQAGLLPRYTERRKEDIAELKRVADELTQRKENLLQNTNLTFNHVIWNQDVLDRVAHLNPETGEPLLGQIDRALHSNKPALDRMAVGLDLGSQLDNKLYSRPPIATKEYWFNDSQAEAIDIANGMGPGDKFVANILDSFKPFFNNPSFRGLYDVIDLARTKKTARQTRFREDYHRPLQDKVVAYARLLRIPGLGGLAIPPVIAALTVGVYDFYNLSILFVIGAYPCIRV